MNKKALEEAVLNALVRFRILEGDIRIRELLEREWEQEQIVTNVTLEEI